MIIHAEPGETFVMLYRRAKDHLLVTARSYVDVTHNDILVTIYEASGINDSCKIYDLKKTIQRLEKKV